MTETLISVFHSFPGVLFNGLHFFVPLDVFGSVGYGPGSDRTDRRLRNSSRQAHRAVRTYLGGFTTDLVSSRHSRRQSCRVVFFRSISSEERFSLFHLSLLKDGSGRGAVQWF